MQAHEARNSQALALAARFANLKTRLLLESLNETPESETHALIIRQANEAACLAWHSGCPLLAFPCLFEERALAATEQARRQARRYWCNLQPPAPARAVTEGQATWPRAHLQMGAARKSIDPGSYLMLIRQHHGKTCRPRPALSGMQTLP
jgi:hypothetical protein